MVNFFDNELFMLCLNLGAYILAGLIIRFLGLKFLNALIPAILIIIAVLLILGIDYEVYERNSEMVSFFLSPCVVALGYVLHKNVDAIKENLKSILLSITLGVIVNLLTINIIMSLLDSPMDVIYSLQPKSVTTPIALSLSEINGGLLPLTAMVVIIAGIYGNVAGGYLLRIFKISNPIAQGLALGSCAHGIGTAKAVELGPKQAATSGLAIGLTGLITALVLPLLKDLFI